MLYSTKLKSLGILFGLVSNLLSSDAIGATIEATQTSRSGARVSVILNISATDARIDLKPGECRSPSVTTDELWRLSRPTSVRPVCRPDRVQAASIQALANTNIKRKRNAGYPLTRSSRSLGLENQRQIKTYDAVLGKRERLQNIFETPNIQTARLQIAEPPIPAPEAVAECMRRVIVAEPEREKDVLSECIAASAFPKEYRLAKACMDNPSYDSAQIVLCSTGQPDLLEEYGRVKEVTNCLVEKEVSVIEAAGCVGLGGLSDRDRKYGKCILDNAGDVAGTAICAFGSDLTPEQQIALSCAVQTGGEPNSYVACAGGQLLERELNKCLQHGIGGERGCFGKNNEFRKFYDRIDDVVANVLGKDSAAYDAWKFMKDNVYAPGENHEVVKAINTALNDLQNGPGQNNDLVKAANAITSGLNAVSVGGVQVSDTGVQVGPIKIGW